MSDNHFLRSVYWRFIVSGWLIVLRSWDAHSCRYRGCPIHDDKFPKQCFDDEMKVLENDKEIRADDNINTAGMLGHFPVIVHSVIVHAWIP
jgi:hypothetical protein